VAKNKKVGLLSPWAPPSRITDMRVTIFSYDKDRQFQHLDSLADVPPLSSLECLWIDVQTDSRELVAEVASKFSLHELTVEDCLDKDHLPKLEDYGSYLFLIFRGIAIRASALLADEINEEEREHSDEEEYTSQVAMYLSEKFVITIRTQEISWFEAVLRQVRQHPEKSMASGPDAIAHRVIDVGIDRFERGLEMFDRKIDILEEAAIRGLEEFEMYQILDLKRELIALRQIARSQRAIMLRLSNETSPIVEPERKRYFKDIDDQAVSLINTLDKLVDNIQGVRDAYFAMSNVRLGDTMRILAIITTILAPLNIMVGIYGMNFEVMPLIHNKNGFWIMVSLLLITTIGMLAYFRRKRWM
jgi:magnesium transporter